MAGHSIVEDFADLTFVELLDLGKTLARVPSGCVVGIWTNSDYCYSIFNRTPKRELHAPGINPTDKTWSKRTGPGGMRRRTLP